MAAEAEHVAPPDPRLGRKIGQVVEPRIAHPAGQGEPEKTRPADLVALRDRLHHVGLAYLWRYQRYLMPAMALGALDTQLGESGRSEVAGCNFTRSPARMAFALLGHGRQQLACLGLGR